MAIGCHLKAAAVHKSQNVFFFFTAEKGNIMCNAGAESFVGFRFYGRFEESLNMIQYDK